MVEKKYAELKNKYNLPSFEELDKEFDISSIENDKFLLRDIRNKIVEKLDEVTNLFSEMLQPDTNISNLYESAMLSEKEKYEVFRLYKTLMSWLRKSQQVMVLNDDKGDAEFICNVFKEWLGLKKRLAPIFEKLSKEWQVETSTKEDLRYLG